MAKPRKRSAKRVRRIAAAPKPLSRAQRRKVALAAGVAAADTALAQTRAAALRAVAAPPKGLLVAEGDSWFDYPLRDVLHELQEMRWQGVSVAHYGDTVESMAYDPPQFARLTQELQRLAGQTRVPNAILLSGGGNDIA